MCDLGPIPEGYLRVSYADGSSRLISFALLADAEPKIIVDLIKPSAAAPTKPEMTRWEARQIKAMDANIECTPMSVARARELGHELGAKIKIARQLGQPWIDEGRTGARIASGITEDREDPGLSEIDPETRMQEKYLVLSDEERARGFVRPVRLTYVHETCGVATSMGVAIAETYARDPSFYGGTYCVRCRDHFPVGAGGEFVWEDGSKVGT